ncbi:MAG: oxyR [Gammaproteobacteria bacterium]|jgi:LysR family hydrogen peroxide-inducible transcriptional activator|nr:oxyR [Gammaproteobacteria bacterium]
MNLRDLKYLVSLAELKHFGKAADACFISQPALSIQIKKLEKYLGVQLLERNNKSVLLTDIGQTIAEQAILVLQEADKIRELAKVAKDPFAGELKLGIIPTLSPYLLPHIMPKLSQSFPKLSFYLVEEQTQVLEEKLRQGKIDAAILATAMQETNISQHFLFEEKFLLAVPSAHPLAKQKKAKLENIQQTGLLLLEDGHCLRDQVLSFCQYSTDIEKQNFRATSLETLRHMVIAGTGLTLMPELACYPHKKITYIPLGAPQPSRQISLYWRTSSAKNILLQALAQQLEKLSKAI